MINRDDYLPYITKKLYRTSGKKANAFTVPLPMIRLMGMYNGGSVLVSMAKDGSHIIIEPARDSEDTELKHEPR